MSKLIGTIREAIEKAGLKDGMTISFHHHMRNGDYVLNMVLAEAAAMGIRDLTVNGITELISLISGKLSAFTGNSGVGKSSILNAIEPGFSLRVDAVSEKLGRGKHTTRHVELFQLSCGAEVIDTPGFSSFEAEELGLELKEHLPECFVEFRPYLDKCRFVGCSHTREKGCAVLQAVRAGEIPASRHQSYLRLCQELKDLKAWNANPGQNPAHKNR